MGDSLDQKSLSGTWFSVKDYSFGGSDSQIFVNLGVGQREFNSLLDLLDLLLETTDVGIGLGGSLLHLHDVKHGVSLVL